jgi:hypothetical protein
MTSRLQREREKRGQGVAKPDPYLYGVSVAHDCSPVDLGTGWWIAECKTCGWCSETHPDYRTAKRDANDHRYAHDTPLIYSNDSWEYGRGGKPGAPRQKPRRRKPPDEAVARGDE